MVEIAKYIVHPPETVEPLSSDMYQSPFTSNLHDEVPRASCYSSQRFRIWRVDASRHTPASGPRRSSNLSPVPIHKYSFNISSYPKSCVKSLPSGYLSITFNSSLFRLIFWHVKIKSFAFTNLTSDMEQIFLDFSCYESLLFSLFFILTNFYPDLHIISKLIRLTDWLYFTHFFTHQRKFLWKFINQLVFRSRRFFCTFGVNLD